MHPPDPHRSIEPHAVRSLGSAFVGATLALATLFATMLTVTTAAEFVGGPPILVAVVAIFVGAVTVLAVPVGIVAAGRRLRRLLGRRKLPDRERRFRRRERPPTRDPNGSDPRSPRV